MRQLQLIESIALCFIYLMQNENTKKAVWYFLINSNWLRKQLNNKDLFYLTMSFDKDNKELCSQFLAHGKLKGHCSDCLLCLLNLYQQYILITRCFETNCFPCIYRRNWMQLQCNMTKWCEFSWVTRWPWLLLFVIVSSVMH